MALTSDETCESKCSFRFQVVVLEYCLHREIRIASDPRVTQPSPQCKPIHPIPRHVSQEEKTSCRILNYPHFNPLCPKHRCLLGRQQDELQEWSAGALLFCELLGPNVEVSSVWNFQNALRCTGNLLFG